MIIANGCSNLLKQPNTLGEEETSFSYIPLDPFPVFLNTPACSGKKIDADLINYFPDQAVRMAVGQVDSAGSVVYGPIKVGIKGQTYHVVVDYINSDTDYRSFYIKRLEAKDGVSNATSIYDPGNSLFQVSEVPFGMVPKSHTNLGDLVEIPVYVGVGLRVTAYVTVINGTANLSSLGAIAADAEAGKITGSIVVQTLGISGKSISTALPLPSELNQTTIQNAILSLAAIKASLYDKNTLITPRVVGIYNPVGGGAQLVNSIISSLASYWIQWTPYPCYSRNNQHPN